jgi:hypothetical protein
MQPTRILPVNVKFVLHVAQRRNECSDHCFGRDAYIGIPIGRAISRSDFETGFNKTRITADRFGSLLDDPVSHLNGGNFLLGHGLGLCGDYCEIAGRLPGSPFQSLDFDVFRHLEVLRSRLELHRCEPTFSQCEPALLIVLVLSALCHPKAFRGVAPSSFDFRHVALPQATYTIYFNEKPRCCGA